MFVRDVILTDDIANKYQPNTIIREKAFIDASCRVMGMITSHRFGILSNHMININNIEKETEWGLCV